MIIKLINKNNKYVAKDIIDIDFDMSIVGDDNKGFYIKVNNKYRYNEKFATEEEAQKKFLYLIDCRNQLENELRNF